MNDSDKILNAAGLRQFLDRCKSQSQRVVHCHGVFDLMHPGHIRHFQEARRQGDCLLVSLTTDRYVNKGVGRPVFTQQLRAETIAALACVDAVFINDDTDAVALLNLVAPSVYVKGGEYAAHAADITGKIAAEVAAVERHGGRIYYTHDVTFSSSQLLNDYFQTQPAPVRDCLAGLRARHDTTQLLSMLDRLSALRVLVLGDAIIDEYQTVVPMGQSGKGMHPVVRCTTTEEYAGGVFAVANHAAQFSSRVTLATIIGDDERVQTLMQGSMNPHLTTQTWSIRAQQTLVKKRYVTHDGEYLAKLFETYEGSDPLVTENVTGQLTDWLAAHATDFDLVIMADFGNGFATPALRQALAQLPCCLAVNAQINSGNRGYHVVTHFPRADYISLNEPELRLTVHDRWGALPEMIASLAKRMQSRWVSVTRGTQGVLAYDAEIGMQSIPALTTQVVDRVGAGDSFFALSAMALAAEIPYDIAALFGSLAAALDVQIVGNKSSVEKVALSKYLTALLR